MWHSDSCFPLPQFAINYHLLRHKLTTKNCSRCTYVSCGTNVMMNVFAFIGKQQTCSVSNLEGITFLRLLRCSCSLTSLFMTPVSKLGVRGNVLIITPILFLICCFFGAQRNKIWLVGRQTSPRTKREVVQFVSLEVSVHSRELLLVTLVKFGGWYWGCYKNPCQVELKRTREEAGWRKPEPGVISMWQRGRWEAGCFGEITLTGMTSPPAFIPPLPPALSLSRHHP